MSSVHLASGVPDDTVRIEEVSENVEIPLQFGRTQIPKTSSKIKLNHICFTDNATRDNEFVRHTNDDIVKMIRTQQLNLFFGNNCASKYEMDFIIDLNGITIIENTYCIKLPYDFMFGEIILESIANHDLCIEFLSSSEFRRNIEMTLLYERIIVPNYIRRGFFDRFVRKVQCVEKIGYGEMEHSNETNIALSANHIHYTKGLFIHGDTNKITNMQLTLNGFTRFSYNKVMIHLYCNKINNSLFYVPFNQLNDFRNNDNQSYDNSLNCSRIQSMRIIFKYDYGNFNINVYAIHSNFMIYMNGFAHLSTRLNSVIATLPPDLPLVALNTNRTVRANPRLYTVQIANIETQVCPITHENITQFYGKCLKCNNVFDFTAISNWLKDHHTCPLCRGEWTNYIMYERIVNATT